MFCEFISGIKLGRVLCLLLLPALAGCGSGGGAPIALEEALSLAAAADAAAVDPDLSDVDGNTPGPSGESDLFTDTDSPLTQTTPESSLLTSQSPDTDGSDGSTASVSDAVVVVSGTTLGSRRLADLPRDNPDAADLLDHWGHRPVHKILEGLSLTDADAEADGADLLALRTAAQTGGDEPDAQDVVVGDAVRITGTGETGSEVVAPNLLDGDTVRILGVHRGVTYGRWTGGPADTLSIEFDLSEAGWQMTRDPSFRAMLERAGKVWSQRIADTWDTWTWAGGTLKGYLAGTDPAVEVRADADGETSTGLEIAVTDADLDEDFAGLAGPGFLRPGDSWEPHFGSIAIDRDHLRTGVGARLFSTLTHEIGHVLGAWQGGPLTADYTAYTDEATGTWTGPNVVALHGGPAPFQDESDPTTWVDGERDPLASQFDFAHSGICASLLSYCTHNAALPAFLPHALDFAFLADLGLTITDETSRPETYGLAGWMDYAGFTLSVSRDLSVSLADPQPHYDGRNNPWQALDVFDLLQADANAFGYRSTGDFSLSYPTAGLLGTVRYAGGLIGTALDRAWLPPVIGDAALAVNLDTLDGTASFTSLTVYTDGLPETFIGGRLHYPFELSANALIGTDTRSTFLADFYGPAHEEVAGTLHDPRAGLLASFGAAYDDRPVRADVVASANYIYGRSYQHGSADPAADGWYRYRCGTDSACESRHVESGRWTDWTATTRDRVLASTAGWSWQGTGLPEADYDFVRITRQSSSSTDGAQGRHAVDSYTGTLEHVTFETGFERYRNWLDDDGTLSDYGNTWAGFQGTLSGWAPQGLARWSGPMIGLQSNHAPFDNPFVEGLATVDYSLSTNRLDVAFSGVTSRDGQRALADFAFEDLLLAADGTFASSDTSGSLNGAFFGPSHKEAAGEFHHNVMNVTGSFGAVRLPDTVTLEETSTVPELLNSTDSQFYAYDDWGFWGKQFDETIFGAFIAHQISEISEGGMLYEGPYTLIDGSLTGSNPVSGTAVWSGQVRAVDMQADTRLTPVSGTARLEVDFSRATVDADFTDFDHGHDDLSWRALRLTDGAFQGTQDNATIGGAFYGSEHQGAAGTFEDGRLRGIFGAVRN